MMLWVWLTLGIHTLYGQESKFTVPDSLKHYSYVQLFRSYQKVESDTLKSKLYLSTILENAKNSKDSLRMAVGYCYLAYYTAEELKKLALLDSSIAISENLNHPKYPIKAYSFKGGYYLKKRDYQLALDNYIRALELSENVSNLEYLKITRHNIGVIKTRIGKHEEALGLFKENFEYASKKYESNKQPYLNSLISLAESYTHNQKMDSASIHNKEGIVLAQKNENLRNKYYGKLVLNEGINLFYKNEYNRSYDSITKGISLLDKNNPENIENHILGSFYLGKLYLTERDIVKAEKEFIRMDSIIQKRKITLSEVRDGYEFLIGLYKSKGEKEQQLLYINKLLNFDKRISKERESISTRLYKEYDTPLLLKEKEKLIQELKKNTNNLSFWVGFLIILSFSITILMYYQYVNRKKYQQKFNELIEKSKEVVVTTKKPLDDIGIADEIVEELLSRLTTFEENHRFLEKNISITTLSKEMDTNTKYLSKVINHHKNKSFTNYVNELRVLYSVEQLKESATLKNYTIQGIAEEMGFNNAESFSSAFKKTTGIKPSYFIRKICALNS